MKYRTYKAYRMPDRQEIEYIGMIPETPEDFAELERLDQQGLLSRGDSFPELEEHQRLAEHRRRARAKKRADVPAS